jgi:hypothetical protein
MSKTPVDITGKLAVLMLVITAVVIYRAGLPHVPKPNPWDGCELIQAVKTEERRYCGKACSMPVYADTYQCPAGQKTWLNARWSIK